MIAFPPHQMKDAAACGPGEMVFHEGALLMTTARRTEAAIFTIELGSFKVRPLMCKEFMYKEADVVLSIGDRWQLSVPIASANLDRHPDQPGLLIRSKDGWYVSAVEGLRPNFVIVGIDVDSAHPGFGHTAVFDSWSINSKPEDGSAAIELFRRMPV